MSTVYLTCFYCGKEWTQTVYYMAQLESIKCPICNDSKIKVRKEDSKTDVFGYNQTEPMKDAYIKRKE